MRLNKWKLFFMIFTSAVVCIISEKHEVKVMFVTVGMVLFGIVMSIENE